MQDEDPHQAAPEQPGQPGDQGAADHVAKSKGHQETEDRPVDEGTIDPADHRILDQVRRKALLVAALGVDEEPAHVGVKEAAQLAAQTATVVDVGAVRVALLIGEGVVLAVIGDPGDDRPLDRRRAEDRQQAVQPAAGLEAAVGEVAVKADGDPKAGQQVEPEEEEDVAPVQGAVPDLPGGEADRDEWDQRHQTGDDPVASLVGDRLDVGGQRSAHAWR